MTPKIKSLLGLAKRAGKVYSGESQIEALLKKKKGELLIIAKDSTNALTKFQRWSQDLKIPVIIDGSKEEIGISIGMSPRSAVLIIDKGFAQAMLKDSKNEDPE